MTKTDQFLDLYKKLENAANTHYHIRGSGSAIAKLQRRQEFSNIHQELDYIRDVRNLLTHRPRIGEFYAVEPTDAMLSLLEKLIDRLEHPLSAIRIAVPLEEVLSASLDSPVLDSLEKMYKRAFSHMPILEDGKVVGVFSGSSLMNCVLYKHIMFSGDLKFRDIKDTFTFDQHPSETFRFVSRDTLVSDISDMFDETLQQEERIGMIFVTENGKSDEELLGIITAWDVAAAIN
ncbi:MAG: CBS domain-containing protein [Lachnospiraceae bacterium]|nr:CBS domain-containing protein [Lachnospiraceae bacterium]MBR6357437.1 CBS domain-containing protein [Lachnospiraceae bacterium]